MDSLAPTRGVRIRPGRTLVHLACLVALLLGACSRQAAGPERYTPSATPVPTSPVGCGLQSLPASWLMALKPTAITPASAVSLLARDATSKRALYVRVGSKVDVVVGEPDGGERTLYTLGSQDSVLSGAIDGEWVVVAEGGVDSDLGTHGVYARRLTGGERVDVATTGADGSGPMPWPVLHEGVAYVQVASAGGANPLLRAVNLVSGARSEWPVASQKGPMVRWGDLLVWPSSSGVAAFDLRARRVVDAPQQLRTIGDAAFVSSDGQTIVWEGKGLVNGWARAYRAGWADVGEITLPEQLVNPGLSSWGRYAVVFVRQRHLIFDLETGQFAPLTIEWGSAIASGGLLATSEMATSKGGSAGLYELDLTAVPPLPACTR